MSMIDVEPNTHQESNHWVVLDVHADRPDQAQVKRLAQQIELALSDLGRIDYQLNSALSRLRCDMTDQTPDNLNGQLSKAIAPGVRNAIAILAGELAQAQQLTRETIEQEGSRAGTDS